MFIISFQRARNTTSTCNTIGQQHICAVAKRVLATRQSRDTTCLVYATPTILQARNEELVVKAAKVSEEDMAAVQAECERRLGAAERKVYALAKERDALRRGSDKLSSANDLLKEKDNIIAQVRRALLATALPAQ